MAFQFTPVHNSDFWVADGYCTGEGDSPILFLNVQNEVHSKRAGRRKLVLDADFNVEKWAVETTLQMIRVEKGLDRPGKVVRRLEWVGAVVDSWRVARQKEGKAANQRGICNIVRYQSIAKIINIAVVHL